jgi:hypothetical protein
MKKPIIPNRPQSNLTVYEPHEFNRILADQQAARGEERNIPRPTMAKAFQALTTPPVMRDLRVEAQDAAVNRGRKGAKRGKKLPLGPLAGNESVKD